MFITTSAAWANFRFDIEKLRNCPNENLMTLYFTVSLLYHYT